MANFAAALPFLLAHEGGYSNDPADPGGETMYGITVGVARSHGYTGDMRQIPMSLVTEIYSGDYWRFDAVESQATATKLLDAAANMGLTTAVRLAQQAVNTLVEPKVVVDGQWGPDTLDAVNTADEKEFLQNFSAELAGHYREIVANKPTSGKFLSGWLKRAMSLPPMGIVAGGIGILGLVGVGLGLFFLSKNK